MMGIRKVGDWKRAMSGLDLLRRRSHSAVHRALLQEAHRLRNLAIQGLTRQAPGGKAIRPVSELTLASRRLRRIFGTKALIVQADLRNSIVVKGGNGRVFVGVLRTARSGEGRPLFDVASVQEFGSGPIIIPLTPRMRRFLHRILREAGTPAARSRVSGAKVVVTQVPPRPFLRPAYGVFTRQTALRFRERFLREIHEGSL